MELYHKRKIYLAAWRAYSQAASGGAGRGLCSGHSLGCPRPVPHLTAVAGASLAQFPAGLPGPGPALPLTICICTRSWAWLTVSCRVRSSCSEFWTWAKSTCTWGWTQGTGEAGVGDGGGGGGAVGKGEEGGCRPGPTCWAQSSLLRRRPSCSSSRSRRTDSRSLCSCRPCHTARPQGVTSQQEGAPRSFS